MAAIKSISLRSCRYDRLCDEICPQFQNETFRNKTLTEVYVIHALKMPATQILNINLVLKLLILHLV